MRDSDPLKRELFADERLLSSGCVAEPDTAGGYGVLVCLGRQRIFAEPSPVDFCGIL